VNFQPLDYLTKKWYIKFSLEFLDVWKVKDAQIFSSIFSMIDGRIINNLGLLQLLKKCATIWSVFTTKIVWSNAFYWNWRSPTRNKVICPFKSIILFFFFLIFGHNTLPFYISLIQKFHPLLHKKSITLLSKINFSRNFAGSLSLSKVLCWIGALDTSIF